MGIKELFNKIFKKEKQKMFPVYSDFIAAYDINLEQIQEFLKSEKYKKMPNVSIYELKKSEKKKLLKKLEENMGGRSNWTHDDYSLVEGSISGEDFISVRKKNVGLNRTGQIIITENEYIDISVKKAQSYNTFLELKYKEYSKNDEFRKTEEFDELNDLYYLKVQNNDLTFSESASYAEKDEIYRIEKYAQPSEDKITCEMYSKLTGLPVIDKNNSILDIFKSNPYVVNIQVKKQNKNLKINYTQSITKAFKSKKECLVGYKPTIILHEIYDGDNKNINTYRLLEDGSYIDNKTFKINDGMEYIFKKVFIDDIENSIKYLPFSLSKDAKKVIKNGLEIQEYIKKIFESGINQINNINIEKEQ